MGSQDMCRSEGKVQWSKSQSTKKHMTMANVHFLSRMVYIRIGHVNRSAHWLLLKYCGCFGWGYPIPENFRALLNSGLLGTVVSVIYEKTVRKSSIVVKAEPLT